MMQKNEHFDAWRFQFDVLQGYGFSWPLFFFAIAFNPKFLGIAFMKFIGSVSFEIYLVHMLIYRCIEKVVGVYPFGKGWISFFVILCLDLIGACLFVYVYKKCVGWIVGNFLKKNDEETL